MMSEDKGSVEVRRRAGGGYVVVLSPSVPNVRTRIDKPDIDSAMGLAVGFAARLGRTLNDCTGRLPPEASRLLVAEQAMIIAAMEA